jgi:glucan phosphoethanolaminetransferase (alkaline phosphatase superfamily)
MILVYILIAVTIVLLTIISTNIRRALFNWVTSIIVGVFSLIGIIAFWYFIYQGDVYDNWYPLVGHFVSAHGAFIGIVLWQYLEVKGRSFSEQWSIWMRKIKRK